MRRLATLLRILLLGSAVGRFCTLAGLLLTVLGAFGIYRYPEHVWGSKYSPSPAIIAFSAVVGLTPVLGCLLLFLGGGLMPAIFWRLSRGRQLSILPGGRARLLFASFIVLSIVAAAFTTVIEALYANYPLDQSQVMGKAFVI